MRRVRHLPTFQDQPPLQQTQWRQRNVHTHTFKIYEYGAGFTHPVQLMVQEIDSTGHARVRSLEQFFYGIVGHVRDDRGRPINGSLQSTRLTNYWRRHFDVPENRNMIHLQQMSLLRKRRTRLLLRLRLRHPSLPLKSSSLRGFCKMCCLKTKQPSHLASTSNQSSAASLNPEGLTQLSAHLAILANMMAPRTAAAAEIPDDDSMQLLDVTS